MCVEVNAPLVGLDPLYLFFLLQEILYQRNSKTWMIFSISVVSLCSAQKDSSETGNQKTAEERRLIEGLLDGRGEYTLVYEDNEGDRMLVGDVPWK